MNQTYLYRTITVLASAAFAGAALAQHNEIGDAGSLPGSAQTVAAGTALISGSIGQDGDSDMYRFTLTNAAAFSATVAPGTTGPLDDSQLFLFRLDGTGIAHNDDITNANFMSNLTVGNSLYNGLAAGDYLLAISGWDDDAKTGANYIFATSPGYTGGVGNIVGQLNAGAITGWDGAAFGVSSGSYEIRLTGVEVVPEPATMAVLGLGAMALIRRRRKA